MRLEVRLFAVCRERAGTDRLAVYVDAPHGVPQLRAAIEAACPALGPLLRVSRLAVNHEFAAEDQVISATDELALIPPVSGGAGLFALTSTPIDVAAVERAVASSGAGALVSFVGTVRDHTGPHAVVALEYEAYTDMAERFLARIGGEVAERWPGARCAIVHRVGHLEVGEASVAIAVSSAHRADAFEGCRHAIERLKQDVPIWKRELRKDGSVWVGVGS